MKSKFENSWFEIGLVILLNVIWVVSSLASSDLTYIESHLLRISSNESSDQWIVPFYQTPTTTTPMFTFELLSTMDWDFLSMIQDVQSKRWRSVQAKVDSRYGSPIDVSACAQLGFQYKHFTQSFSSNTGVLAMANDPVFPEIKLFFFWDFQWRTQYQFRPMNNISITPAISYGRRKLLNNTFSAAELLFEKPSFRLNNIAWKTFINAGISGKLSLDLLELNAAISSIPLWAHDYNYWDSTFGFRSLNFCADNACGVLNNLSFYSSFSPFFRGKYDSRNTLVFGTSLQVLKFISWDIFLHDEDALGSILKTAFRYGELEFFTFRRSLDSRHLATSRQYGGKFVVQY